MSKPGLLGSMLGQSAALDRLVGSFNPTFRMTAPAGGKPQGGGRRTDWPDETGAGAHRGGSAGVRSALRRNGTVTTED
jgi:hypothetical protein